MRLGVPGAEFTVGSADYRAEVARIRAERHALQAKWEAIVRARLEEGPATTTALGHLVGADTWSPFWGWMRAGQTFAVRSGKRIDINSGRDNIVWVLK